MRTFRKLEQFITYTERQEAVSFENFILMTLREPETFSTLSSVFIKSLKNVQGKTSRYT